MVLGTVFKLCVVAITCIGLIAVAGATKDCCQHGCLVQEPQFAMGSSSSSESVLPSIQEMMCHHTFESMVNGDSNEYQPVHSYPWKSAKAPKCHATSYDERLPWPYANHGAHLPPIQRTNSMSFPTVSQPSRLSSALLTQAMVHNTSTHSPTQHTFDEDCPSKRNRTPTVDACIEASKLQNPSRPPKYPVPSFEARARSKLGHYLSSEMRSHIPQELYQSMPRAARDELFRAQPLSAQKLVEVKKRILEQKLVVVIYVDPHNDYEIDFKVLYNPVHGSGCGSLAEVLQGNFSVAKISSEDSGNQSDEFIRQMRIAVDDKNWSNRASFW